MKIDSIFIDTSIFVANNFFESKRINEILKLSEEGYINIVIPELIYKEIISQSRKRIADALQKYDRYRRDTKVLRNIPILIERFGDIDKEDCVKEFESIIESRLKKAKVEVLDYPIINIKDIFDSYFDNKFPFSNGIKKNEFPDAFALVSIENWCIKNTKKCFIFTKDKDLIQFKSKYLEFVDYEKYLSNKLKEIEIEKEREERLDKIDDLFYENKEQYYEKIEQWATSELQDYGKFYSYFDSMEIHDIDVQEVEAYLDDLQITSITDTKITLQCQATLDFTVEVSVDDENTGVYDSEDKVWNYYETKEEIISDSRFIIVDFNYVIPTAGEEFAELEIEDINEGKNLKI